LDTNKSHIAHVSQARTLLINGKHPYDSKAATCADLKGQVKAREKWSFLYFSGKLHHKILLNHCVTPPRSSECLHVGTLDDPTLCGRSNSTTAEHADLPDESKDAEEGGDSKEDEERDCDVVVSHVLLILVVLVLGPTEPDHVEDWDQEGDGEDDGTANHWSEKKDFN